MKLPYVVDTRFFGEKDYFPVYAWAKTEQEAIDGVVKECLDCLQLVHCKINKELTEKWQTDWKAYNKLSWWKKLFTSVKLPI